MLTKKEKELVKELNENMPEFTGTKVEIEKKIAMYIYLELGKRKVFDERFFLANKKDKEKIKKRHKVFGLNMDEVVKNRRIVCKSLSTLYKDVLNAFGIKAYNEKVNNDDSHICNLIRFSDKTMIVADLQQDLYNIQTRSKTKHFGEDVLQSENSLDEEELFQLHKACGYVETKNAYMDAKIENLKSKIENLPPDEILKNILEDKDINDYQEDIGYIELYNYFSKLIAKIAPRYDRRDINYFNCYRNKEDEKGKEYKDYTMCIYSVYKDEIKSYLYSKKENTFKPVDILKFDDWEREGLFLGRNQKEQGLKVFRRYLNRELEKKIKSTTNHNRDEEVPR